MPNAFFRRQNASRRRALLPPRPVAMAVAVGAAALLSPVGPLGGPALANPPVLHAATEPPGTAASSLGNPARFAPPAATGAAPTVGAPPADPPTRRIFRPRFSAAGVLETGGGTVRLAGIAPPALDAQCGTGADAWPCGRMARTALRRLVGGRAIECRADPVEDALPDRTRCHMGARDIGGWLVAQGWAKAEDPRYARAEAAARTSRRGIWSPTREGASIGNTTRPAPRASTASDGHARVRVEVDLSAQRMRLFHRGAPVGEWPVSTARAGKITPTGRWTAQWLSRHHRSSLYGNAPMPYAVFFNGDYAIHGTNEIARLGRPASAGCIRLHPRHAKVVFGLVRSEGLKNTVVVVRP